MFVFAEEIFLKELPEAHNSYRETYQATPVILNSELTAAQRWADHMLEGNARGHSDTKDGENVFFMSSSASVNSAATCSLMLEIYFPVMVLRVTLHHICDQLK